MLELFHGPTLAFKDMAARFMARTAAHIMTKTQQSRTLIVATSGDTGGAIGYSFLDQPGINVVILFPKNGVSKMQEQHLTTIGAAHSNVSALRVDGSFDDCQDLVKAAFVDKALNQKLSLMSANSINVGRVIPQSFYYLWTSLQIKAAHPGRPIIYAIPSGNLGNLTGGLMAKKMGAPIDKFIIGNNANNPFVDYLKTGTYTPRAAIPTLSNAMDIGRPNNFARILRLYEGDYHKITQDCWGADFSDDQAARHMRHIYRKYGYAMCPHTAIGDLAMKAYLETHNMDNPVSVTVGTAHWGKFSHDVIKILREDLTLPRALSQVMDKTPHVSELANNPDSFKQYLLNMSGVSQMQEDQAQKPPSTTRSS